MKLYIATIILRYEGGSNAETFVNETPNGVAVLVATSLLQEEVPFDYDDILHECEKGNQESWNEPLSLGDETDSRREFLLTTKVVEI